MILLKPICRRVRWRNFHPCRAIGQCRRNSQIRTQWGPCERGRRRREALSDVVPSFVAVNRKGRPLWLHLIPGHPGAEEEEGSRGYFPESICLFLQERCGWDWK